MPTIHRYKGFRFHFYSSEGSEPPHVHIRRAEDSCKFWLRPVALAYNDGMRTTELTELEQVIHEHRDEFERQWHEYFGE
jgi:hypothetical protein